MLTEIQLYVPDAGLLPVTIKLAVSPSMALAATQGEVTLLIEASMGVTATEEGDAGDGGRDGAGDGGGEGGGGGERDGGEGDGGGGKGDGSGGAGGGEDCVGGCGDCDGGSGCNGGGKPGGGKAEAFAFANTQQWVQSQPSMPLPHSWRSAWEP